MKNKPYNQKTKYKCFIFKTFNKKGLTLLEVLFSLVLFTSISIALMRISSKTIQYKKKVTRNVKEVKTNRNVIQIIKKDLLNIFYTQDINAFNYRNFFLEKNKLSHLFTQDPSLPTENTQTASSTTTKEKQQIYNALTEYIQVHVTPYVPDKPSAVGGMIGQHDNLHMVSRSYRPNQENEKKSDQNIVSYYLKNCKSRENNKEQSTCLWRRFSSHIHQNLEDPTDYSEFVLLEKVKKFELYYYRDSSTEWLKEWKTGINEKSVLPSAIQINIEYESKRKRTVKSLIYSALHQQFILPAGTNNTLTRR